MKITCVALSESVWFRAVGCKVNSLETETVKLLILAQPSKALFMGRERRIARAGEIPKLHMLGRAAPPTLQKDWNHSCNSIHGVVVKQRAKVLKHNLIAEANICSNATVVYHSYLEQLTT